MSEKKDWKLPPSKTGGPVVKTGPTAGQNRSRPVFRKLDRKEE